MKPYEFISLTVPFCVMGLATYAYYWWNGRRLNKRIEQLKAQEREFVQTLMRAGIIKEREGKVLPFKRKPK